MLDRIRVALALRERLVYRQPLQLSGPRVITVSFRVTREGKFEDLAVVQDAGLVLVASDLLDGVGSASPIDPFPDFIKEEELHIRFKYYLE
jgi:hypothetical protein